MRNIIENLLKDKQGHHSEFQIENFIVGGEGDSWAQYKQSLREIESRYETILSEREALIIEKKRIENFKKDANGNRAWYNEKIRAYHKRLENAKDVKRELYKFVDLALKLKEEIGEIYFEKRHQLESESWTAKGIKLAAIDFLTSGRLSAQTAEFILSLPKKSQVEVFTKISSNKPFKLLGLNEIEASTNPNNR